MKTSVSALFAVVGAALALALTLLVGLANPAQASTTAIHATPTSSVAGQNVTFTAMFTSSCPGALSTHYFTIDGKTRNGILAQNGQAGTETLSLSTLGVGAHTIRYDWKINGTICRGTASISYMVSPVPSPLPSPSPSPSPTPSPIASPSAVTLVANKPSDSPLAGYVGGALILLVVGSGVALMVLGRR